MLVIRPVTLNDLDAIEALTGFTGFGLTTLPRDAKLLSRRIKESLRGFEKLTDDDRPRGETYLFVLEDLDNHHVAGTCGIVSKVGGFEPFYAYRIESTVHQSEMLGVRKEIRMLHLDEEHDGPCEIGSLFLSPEYRKDGNGRLLSLSRFLFMADHAEYFDPMVIAEMRGVVDEQGRSPFWDAIGHHFFDIDFPKADYLSMVNKRFIADLMPKHPIYVPLLPKEAQEVIGKVHKQTEPALKILEEEHFRQSGQVDIFEGGPVVRCPLKEIRTIHDSVCTQVEELSNAPVAGETYLVANTRHDFRACKATLELTPQGTVRMDAKTAEALRLKAGDAVRFATPRPSPKQEEAVDVDDVALY